MPRVSADVVNVACALPLSVPVPIVTKLSWNVTVPVGVPTPDSFVTVAVNVTDCPTTEGLLEDTTAVVVGFRTVVNAVAELFPGVLSFGDVTVAVFEIVPAVLGAVTTIVMAGAVVLGAMEARVQFTVVVPEQAQPVPADETKVVPAGSGSDTCVV